jgi:hypothetical protein
VFEEHAPRQRDEEYSLRGEQHTNRADDATTAWLVQRRSFHCSTLKSPE